MQDVRKSEVVYGSVVQVRPNSDIKQFRSCFMVVTQPKNWGASGYIALPGESGPPVKVPAQFQWKDIELVGRASFVSGVDRFNAV